MEKGQLEAIDLILNVLREHERNLDRLVTLIDALSTTMARLEYIYEHMETPTQ